MTVSCVLKEVCLSITLSHLPAYTTGVSNDCKLCSKGSMYMSRLPAYITSVSNDRKQKKQKRCASKTLTVWQLDLHQNICVCSVSNDLSSVLKEVCISTTLTNRQPDLHQNINLCMQCERSAYAVLQNKYVVYISNTEPFDNLDH